MGPTHEEGEGGLEPSLRERGRMLIKDKGGKVSQPMKFLLLRPRSSSFKFKACFLARKKRMDFGGLPYPSRQH